MLVVVIVLIASPAEAVCWASLNCVNFLIVVIIRFRRRCDVVNRGLSGYNSDDALQFLPKLFSVENFDPSHVATFIVMIGTNDAICFGKNKEEVLVPHTKYRENLKDLVNYLLVCIFA